MECRGRACRACCLLSLGILFVLSGFTIGVLANPIPIEPHPPTGIPVISSSQSAIAGWVLFVFIVDFFLDTLLVYGGVFLLGYLHLLLPHQVLAMPKTRFFTGVLFISLVGFMAEWGLGVTFWGLFITLWIVLFSFCVVSRYLYGFTWKNAVYFGVFASLVNLLVWLVLFNI
ncbi:MAG TPA: hypothetical protein VMT57_08665 [Candidatus Thermoplasmatota archaeon]|nr:hypothetical protein [Candidatus Thermoplasmatota archaeon]